MARKNTSRIRLQDFWKVSSGNVRVLARRVHRSVSTLLRWKREGFPQSIKPKIKSIVTKAKLPTPKKKPIRKQVIKKPVRKPVKKPTVVQKIIRIAVQPEPLFVPLTANEKREQGIQLELAKAEQKRIREVKDVMSRVIKDWKEYYLSRSKTILRDGAVAEVAKYVRDILPTKPESEWTVSDFIRGGAFAASIAELRSTADNMDQIDNRLYDLADEFGMPVKEIYELYYSPQVA